VRAIAAVTLIVAVLSGTPSTAAGGNAVTRDDSSSTLCPPATPAAHPHAAKRIRVGVDPGRAGNPLPSSEAPKPVNRGKEMRALERLRPRHRTLVVRLNRLFWSGGAHALARFRREAARYARHRFDVEVQVRYHPTDADNGDIEAWRRWVRHVVDVLGSNRRLIALTITNEINLAISPNTSDGSYDRAKAALVRGVEAAHRELRRRGWGQRVAVGFTFAYRFNPSSDAALFRYLKAHGGKAFRRALGFVGLDDYPGTFYPPSLPPGDTAGHELAGALATMRTCYLPLAGLRRATPLWVTENGFASNAPQHTEARQAQQLRSMVHAVRKYAGAYHVTDYRWFNLRDNASHGDGMFDQDGLLRDDYSRKPSFAALHRFIASHGQASR
jgi:hypothetical protein